MKVRRKIDAVEYREEGDEDGEVQFIILEIDEHRFILDKGDVWNLYTICEPVFNKMSDSSSIKNTPDALIEKAIELEGAYAPKVNRKVVMEKCEK